MSELRDAIQTYTARHADENGISRTPVPGLMMVRASAPTEIIHDLFRPLVCLVVQGSKAVTVGQQSFAFSAGDSLLVTADVPTTSQVTRATAVAPYLSLVLELDPALIADLSAEISHITNTEPVRARVEPTDSEVADAVLRLMRLLDRPASLPVLQGQIIREIHYWLLSGRHGAAIRHLGWPEGHVQRISRAVAILRAEFTHTVPTHRLAAAAGMSASSFHKHFRSVTSLSPLQFQKHLRLIEARRLMQSEHQSATQAAFCVGYESVSQFTREYGRMFGTSPVRDVRQAREKNLQLT